MGLFTTLTDAIGLTRYGAAEEAVQNAQGYFAGMTPPEIQALGLESVGDMSPEQLRAFLQERTAYEDISVDPRLKAQQMDTLSALQEISKAEGLTAQDKALLARIVREEDIKARGQREAIMQSAQERGIAGSGLELASQFQNQQEGATRQAMRDQEIAALAEQRKMQALMGSGELAGQMRGQEYGEQQNLAQARDMLSRFNLANQQQTEAQNVGARNQAQQYNLANQQRIAEENQKFAAMAPQQRFQNQMGLAQAQASGLYNLANMYNQQSSANMQMAGMAALAYAKPGSDENIKKDVALAPDQIDQFLNDLTGYKFNYKDPERYGEGERIGVMAQDVEKSPVGEKMVENDERGAKNIDGGKALSAILASLGRLNEKVNTIEESKYGKR
jgi:hypothetical protein